MESNVKQALEKMEISAGIVVLLSVFKLNLMIYFALSLAIVFAASHFYGNPIRNGIEEGAVTRSELRNRMLKSRYLWGAAGLVIANAAYQAFYS